MKTFTTLLLVVLILAAAFFSAFSFLDQRYFLSAFLIIFCVACTTKLISSFESQSKKQTAPIK